MTEIQEAFEKWAGEPQDIERNISWASKGEGVMSMKHNALTRGEQDYFELTESRAKIVQLEKENTALKAVLAEVEKQTGQVREILRVAANNMAVLHHE